MSRSISFWLIVVVAMFSLSACGSLAREPNKTISLIEADAGRTIALNIGDALEVRLAGNPTTGYSWEWAARSTTVIALLGEPTYKADSNLIGVGGQYTFRFVANNAGQTTLKLIYHRTFEPNVAPLKTFEVTLLVK